MRAPAPGPPPGHAAHQTPPGPEQQQQRQQHCDWAEADITMQGIEAVTHSAARTFQYSGHSVPFTILPGTCPWNCRQTTCQAHSCCVSACTAIQHIVLLLVADLHCSFTRHHMPQVLLLLAYAAAGLFCAAGLCLLLSMQYIRFPPASPLTLLLACATSCCAAASSASSPSSSRRSSTSSSDSSSCSAVQSLQSCEHMQHPQAAKCVSQAARM
jgi:hypothetical protein